MSYARCVGRICSSFGFLSLLALTTFACTHEGDASQQEERYTAVRTRLRPPESIQCPRDRLTSFTGRVLSYRRRVGQIGLKIHTDENTLEAFRLDYAESKGPTQWFLMRGRLFRQEDWKEIESAEYSLRPDMRATIWVCDDGANPIVDWFPAATP
jgi:hypothetical protein